MTRQQEDTLVANRLWSEYARTRSPRTREQIIHQFERLAYSVANRFARRGAEIEDLVQVARLGLIKAVDRFDPSTHNRFSTFAIPTILGELRRYFRDYSRGVHVSRGTQELAQSVRRAEDELAESLGRAPTPAELAARLDVSEARVNEVLNLRHATQPLSLDGVLEAGGEAASKLEECLGHEDRAMASAADRISVLRALQGLAEPLREVIRMRYLEDQSQRAVSQQLGMSQMRVCRMERRALGLMRAQLTVN